MTCSEIDPLINLVSSNYEHLAYTPQFHSECVIAKGSTAMGRFVGLQTVVTLLCGFKKKYEGKNEKKIQISTDAGNLEQWHFQIFFVSYFFC